MLLKMFQALLPYYGGKRKLCPIIFKKISEYLPREKWQKSIFVDAFLGSGAVSLYAKAQGFRIVANDIAERSVIAGKALVENNQVLLTEDDLHRLCFQNSSTKRSIEKEFIPDVFTRKHAVFLDTAFVNARAALDKYLLLKYIFAIRPYSKFSSPNAFNRPMEDGRFDEIKQTYTKHIRDNLKPPLAYEYEYEVLDKILGEEAKPRSEFSRKEGVEALDRLLGKCQRFPLWVISFGNAGGKNELGRLVEMISKHRKCSAHGFLYHQQHEAQILNCRISFLRLAFIPCILRP